MSESSHVESFGLDRPCIRLRISWTNDARSIYSSVESNIDSSVSISNANAATSDEDQTPTYPSSTVSIFSVLS